MANVLFKVGTLTQYEALATKNENTLYWLTDVQRLYKGDVLYGTGAVATVSAAGLLSPEDKAKLDAIVESDGSATTIDLVAQDASILISDTDTGKAIGVCLSAVEGNMLELKDDGLFVPAPAAPVIPDYELERQDTATDGYAVTYKLKKTVGETVTYVGDTIDIPKDLVLKSGSMQTVAIEGVPYEGGKVGDPYLELILNDADSTAIYVPVAGLVDTYVAGNGIEIIDNTVAVKLSAVDANGLFVTADGLGLALATTTTPGAMSAEDKLILSTLADTYATKDELDALAADVAVAEESYTWGEM